MTGPKLKCQCHLMKSERSCCPPFIYWNSLLSSSPSTQEKVAWYVKPLMQWMLARLFALQGFCCGTEGYYALTCLVWFFFILLFFKLQVCYLLTFTINQISLVSYTQTLKTYFDCKFDFKVEAFLCHVHNLCT